MKLDVDGLIMLHIHEVKRSTTRSNQCKVSLVGRVVESAEISIINAEAVLPDVKDSLLGFSVARAGWAEGIGDGTTFDAITTKCLSGSTEAAGLRGPSLAFGFRARSISKSVSWCLPS